MGSDGEKPRKKHQGLPKVPKYEEPNSIPVAGFGHPLSFGKRFGRFGPGSGGAETHRPGALGRAFLWLLGMHHRPADVQLQTTKEHEGTPKTNSEEGTIPQLST